MTCLKEFFLENCSMKKKFPAFWVFIILGFFSTGILLSIVNPTKAAETMGVKIMEKELLGKFLADSQGLSLYSLRIKRFHQHNKTRWKTANGI